MTFVITSQKFEKFQLTKKLKNFMKKWLKIEIFLIFASFFFKNFCFIPPPLKQKISNGLGHICECSYSSLGAQKRCVRKRYSKNRFFRPKMAIFGPKTSSNRLLRSPILMKTFSRVLFSPITHPQF